MNKERLKILGINIKVERIKKQLYQKQLAEKINYSRHSISLIEKGAQNLSALKLIDIAKALEIDINQLTVNL
jgi:transcriptional regulator with XRE-family HTH domain